MSDSPQVKKAPLLVRVGRDIPLQYFNLTVEPDMHTLELEPEETREWFRVRGADMEVVESALDLVWNFGNYKPVTVSIANPREVKNDSRIAPKITI